MTNLANILKTRDIALLTKICTVKAVFFFPVGMYGCESWTIKKAKNRWFQIVVLARLLNPLDSKIKPVNPKGKIKFPIFV